MSEQSALTEILIRDRHIAELEYSLATAERLCETLKQEAQIHAQEARAANATVAEIYQVLTGSTGEPGNWNGAEPARRIMAELAELRRGVEAARAELREKNGYILTDGR